MRFEIILDQIKKLWATEKRFETTCYKFSLLPAIYGLIESPITTEYQNFIYKGLKRQQIITMAKRSRFHRIPLKKSLELPFGGFLFHGELCMILYSIEKHHHSEPLAKLMFKGPTILFPTGKGSLINYEFDDATVLEFDESSGIHRNVNDPFQGYFPKFDPKVLQPTGLVEKKGNEEKVDGDDHIGMIEEGNKRKHSINERPMEKNLILQHVNDTKV